MYVSVYLSVPMFCKSFLAYAAFYFWVFLGDGRPTQIQKRIVGHIFKTKGARQILCASLVLACQNTPLTKFLCNLKKKSFFGWKKKKTLKPEDF